MRSVPDLEKYIPAKWRLKLKKLLDARTYRHSAAVAATAVYLAKRYGAGRKRAAVAGFLHDCAKGLNDSSLKRIMIKHKVSLDAIEKKLPAIWHSFAAPILAREIFGVRDRQALDAMKYHTVGKRGMSRLGKIIYVSDYIEPGRRYRSCRKVRALLNRKKISLDYLVLNVLKEKASYLEHGRKTMHPESIRLYSRLTSKF